MDIEKAFEVVFSRKIKKIWVWVLMVVASILFLFYINRQNKTGNIFDEANLPAAEKQIWKAMDVYDSNLILALADSLEKTGDISAVTANYYRGAAAANKGMLTVSEEYLKKATANTQPEAADLRAYLKSKALLSRILSSESDYEGALNEALPTLAVMDSLGNKDYGDITQLYIVIGECQQHLHMPAEAAATFDKAYSLLHEWMESDITGKDMPRIILRLDNIATSYIHTSEYAKAKIWLDREDSALAIYNIKPDVVEKQADFLKGTIQLDLAAICQQLGREDEAVSHYNEHLNTIFSDRNVARINATDYLMLTGRYGEAADNYIYLDNVFEKRNLDLSLDNIGTYLFPKMRANILAGRKDSAIAVGMKIVECYDSALSRQKQDATAELATRMNGELTEDNEQGMFVTMFIGLLNLKTGHLDFCNAGHNAPVIGGGEHGGEFLDMQPNAPIGLWPDLEYEGEEIDSIKGRPLFIYTDGLNEAENWQQEQLGDERLLEILRATQFENVRQIIDSLSAAVEQHRNGAEPNDDLTMMCIKLV